MKAGTAQASLKPVSVLKEDQDVSEPSPAADYSKRALFVYACVAIFYLYEYILRVSPSVMTDYLMRDFGITSTMVGVLAAFYYFAYVPLQIPCGMIVDRLGPRRVVTASALLCVVGSFLFAKSESYVVAQAGRFLLGAGSACAYLSATKMGAEWFAPEKFAIISSVTMMMGTLGGTFGGRPFAVLVNTVGWREAMAIGGIAGIVIAALVWAIVRDRPPGSKSKQADQELNKQAPLLEGLAIVASNPQSWLIGIYGGLMYVPLSAFTELWAVPYLMQLYNINNELASTASIMFFLGMALGCPTSAIISNRLQSRLRVMSWSALSTLGIFLVIIYVPYIPLAAMCLLLFVGGLLCGGQILYFAASKETNPNRISGTSIGFCNFFVMVSGIIFQPLLGMLLDVAWDGARMSDGTPIYSIEAFKVALTSVPLSLLAAWFVLRFVKETYGQTGDQRQAMLCLRPQR